jgi:hypothetical protein
MISDICLVECVKTKRKEPSKAEDLYVSPLFRSYRQFARAYCRKWYILSAEYGLLEPERIIAPYNKTLNRISSAGRKQWASSIFQELKERLHNNDNVVILAGKSYRQYLVPLLLQEGFKILVPMEGKSIGVQLRWLNTVNHYSDRIAHMERFYRLLLKLEQGLGGKRILAECTGQMDWPKRGVYFLFEPEEMRTLAKTEKRVVRVGTHMVSQGSKATLWNRLRTHRGTTFGRGNHRGSIFRLHVGAAMLSKEHDHHLPSWGAGSAADHSVREAEAEMEKKVSAYIGRMSVLWLNIPDEAGPMSDRAYIERNCISLLGGPSGPIDLPSRGWLGNFCPNESVVRSGLWNVNYVDYRYDIRFLDVLEAYVDVTTGVRPTPQTPIAPTNWYLNQVSLKSPQLEFLL